MTHKAVLTIKNLSLRFLDRPLFDRLSLSVHGGTLLALIGANGCGKSTLLDLISARTAQLVHPLTERDLHVQGEIVVPAGIDVAYLKQVLDARPGSVTPAAVGADDTGRTSQLERDFGLSSRPGAGEPASDGELQKRALVRLLQTEHDLYLLDEPTNYLDMQGIIAFENYVHTLKGRGRGIILVTHDRTLTDNLADQTVLLTGHGVFVSVGGASNALAVKESDLESRRHQARDIRRKIAQLQGDMRAKAGWAARKEKQKIGAGGAKGHISKLSKKLARRAKVAQQRAQKEIERLKQVRPRVPDDLRLSFPPYEIRNRTLFSLRRVSFRYPEEGGTNRGERESLLRDVDLTTNTRDKISLLGANGSGKSTLIALARREVHPTAGTVQVNEAVRTAYIPQGLRRFFSHERLLDNFTDCGYPESKVRQFLGAVRLRREQVTSPLCSFSYGELMRAALVKCLLVKAEFLFLDEPTSHLDIESIEVTERLLATFGGGFLLISHDRSFVQNVTDKLYALRDGRLVLI